MEDHLKIPTRLYKRPGKCWVRIKDGEIVDLIYKDDYKFPLSATRQEESDIRTNWARQAHKKLSEPGGKKVSGTAIPEREPNGTASKDRGIFLPDPPKGTLKGAIPGARRQRSSKRRKNTVGLPGTKERGYRQPPKR